MTYKEWKTAHDIKLSAIMKKLSGVPIDNIIAYFSFDNMVVEEPDFCPLYSTNTKCHDIAKLNCFSCACPYFLSSDTEPFYMIGNVSVMSICSINSKQAGTYISNDIQHCDCTNCHIPHTERSVSAYLRKQKDIPQNKSFLARLRDYQLSSILGKWKLF